MFWNEQNSQQIEILLSNEELKLTDLLDNDDVLQQCKGQNRALMAYLLRIDVLEELIDLITKEPSEDVDESLRFKYPNIACEILTSDIPILKERIVSQHNLLDKLYSFLEQDPPLNPLLTSFFTKTFGMLFAKVHEQDWFTYQCICIQLIGFIKSRNGFLENIYKHLGIPVIVDLLFSIITNVVGDDIKADLYTWFNEQKLIEHLIEILGQDDKSYKNNNIAQFLSELIKWGRTHRQNVLQQFGTYNSICYGDPLLQLLESEQCTELLLQKMIRSNNQSYSTIESGINILLTVLDNPIINQPVSDTALQNLIDVEKEHHRHITGNVLKAIVPYISDFHAILINPTNKPDIKTTIAAISPPFGNVRLQVCTLLTVLIETGYSDIIKSICESEFYNTLLKLFKQYCWNNILHNLVKRCFTFAFPPLNTNVVINSETASTSTLISTVSTAATATATTTTAPTTTAITDIQNHIIVNCKIAPKFIDCWMHNNDMQFEQKRPRLGYMGHLIEMLNLLVCQSSASDDLRALIETNLNDEELKNWNIITNENDGELMKEIQKQQTLLANIDLNAVDTSDILLQEDNTDYSMQNAADIDDGNDDYACEQFEEACEQNSNNFNMDMAAEDWVDPDSLSSNKLPYNSAPFVSNFLNSGDMDDINESSHLHHHHHHHQQLQPFETKGFNNSTTNEFDNFSTDNFSSDNFADFDTYFNTYGNPFDDNDNNNNNNNNNNNHNDPFSNVNNFKNNNHNNNNNFELTQSADNDKLKDKLLPPTLNDENIVILNNNINNHDDTTNTDDINNSKFNNIDVNSLWDPMHEPTTNNKSDTKCYSNNNNNNKNINIDNNTADDDVFQIENQMSMLNFNNSTDFCNNKNDDVKNIILNSNLSSSDHNHLIINDTNAENHNNNNINKHSVNETICSNNIENCVPSLNNNNNNNINNNINNHHDNNNINDIDVKIINDVSDDKLSDVIKNNNVQIINNNLESNLENENENDDEEIDDGAKKLIQNDNNNKKLSSSVTSMDNINAFDCKSVILPTTNAELPINANIENGPLNKDDVTEKIMAANTIDTSSIITSKDIQKTDESTTITKNSINECSIIGSITSDDNNLSCVSDSDVTIASSSSEASSSSSSTETNNDSTATTTTTDSTNND